MGLVLPGSLQSRRVRGKLPRTTGWQPVVPRVCARTRPAPNRRRDTCIAFESVSFSKLGLAVIDEQHKFGVAQRARLTAGDPVPDVLVMTATPIPRTLTMTIYGHLDVSTIDEMPENRGKIVTAVRDTSKLSDVISFLRSELEKGRQLYVIYPLIDESEKLDAKAAAAEYELWRERLHPFRCELLHGRIPAMEKQQIMDRFRRGDTNALISTDRARGRCRCTECDGDAD